MPTISGVHSGFWINWGEFIPSYFVAEIVIVRAGRTGLVQRETHSAGRIRCAITVPSLGVKYSERLLSISVGSSPLNAECHFLPVSLNQLHITSR